jgi:hypothetical protein
MALEKKKNPSGASNLPFCAGSSSSKSATAEGSLSSVVDYLMSAQTLSALARFKQQS